mgnify:CR=1 FL=1
MLSVASEVRFPNKFVKPPLIGSPQIDNDDTKSQQSTMSIVNVVTVVATRRHRVSSAIPESPWGHIPKENWDVAIDSALAALGLTKCTVKHGAITGDR